MRTRFYKTCCRRTSRNDNKALADSALQACIPRGSLKMWRIVVQKNLQKPGSHKVNFRRISQVSVSFFLVVICVSQSRCFHYAFSVARIFNFPDLFVCFIYKWRLNVEDPSWSLELWFPGLAIQKCLELAKNNVNLGLPRTLAFTILRPSLCVRRTLMLREFIFKR